MNQKKENKSIHIGVGVLLDENQNILITKRKKDSTLAGHWEWPGGKREQGEDISACVIREFKEEIDLDINITGYIGSVSHTYDFGTVYIEALYCQARNSPIIIKEKQVAAHQWVAPDQLLTIQFPPANTSLVQVVVDQLKNNSRNLRIADYSLISEKWALVRQTLMPAAQEIFDRFVNSIKTQGQVLDLGCGHGQPITQSLTQRGFQATGVDISKNLIQIAKANIPNANFLIDDITQFPITHNQYDGIVLWDCLFHLPRNKHTPLLEKIYKGLSPNGKLLLTSGGSQRELPEFWDQMFGVNFYYDSLKPSALKQFCTKIGFEIIQTIELNPDTGGQDKGRIAMLLQKTAH